jgi:hypothetical protein
MRKSASTLAEIDSGKPLTLVSDIDLRAESLLKGVIFSKRYYNHCAYIGLSLSGFSVDQWTNELPLSVSTTPRYDSSSKQSNGVGNSIKIEMKVATANNPNIFGEYMGVILACSPFGSIFLTCTVESVKDLCLAAKVVEETLACKFIESSQVTDAMKNDVKDGNHKSQSRHYYTLKHIEEKLEAPYTIVWPTHKCLHVLQKFSVAEDEKYQKLPVGGYIIVDNLIHSKVSKTSDLMKCIKSWIVRHTFNAESIGNPGPLKKDRGKITKRKTENNNNSISLDGNDDDGKESDNSESTMYDSEASDFGIVSKVLLGPKDPSLVPDKMEEEDDEEKEEEKEEEEEEEVKRRPSDVRDSRKETVRSRKRQGIPKTYGTRGRKDEDPESESLAKPPFVDTPMEGLHGLDAREYALAKYMFTAFETSSYFQYDDSRVLLQFTKQGRKHQLLTLNHSNFGLKKQWCRGREYTNMSTVSHYLLGTTQRISKPAPHRGTAFDIYYEEQKSVVDQMLAQGLSLKEVHAEMRSKWDKLSAGKKAHYEVIELEDMERYEKEMEPYNKREEQIKNAEEVYDLDEEGYYIENKVIQEFSPFVQYMQVDEEYLESLDIPEILRGALMPTYYASRWRKMSPEEKLMYEEVARWKQNKRPKSESKALNGSETAGGDPYRYY